MDAVKEDCYMVCDLLVYKDQYRAFNDALALSGITVKLSRYDENSDWECEIDTSEHDKKIMAEAKKDYSAISVTYGDIISEFIQKFPNVDYEDIRPCWECYGVPTISNAIVVWLKDGSKLIYVKGNKDEV